MKKIATLLLTVALLLSLFTAAGAVEAVPISAPLDAVATDEIPLAPYSIHLNGTIQWYSERTDAFAAWDVIAIMAAKRAHIDISPVEKRVKSAAEEIANVLAELAESGYWANYATGVIALESVAADVSAYTETLAAAQNENGSWADDLASTIYSVIALNSAAVVENGKALEFILTKQLENGQFPWYDGDPDVDMTGMALYALSLYSDNEEAAAAIEKVTAYLLESRAETGGYTSMWSETGYENSNGLSVVISGLIAADKIDTVDEASFAKILSGFIRTDGGLAYESVDEGSNYMATYQGMLAIADIFLGESWTSLLGSRGLSCNDSAFVSERYRADIIRAYELEIVRGDTNGAFRPKSDITFAELVTMVLNLTGTGYKSEPSSPWYAAAVESFYVHTGISCAEFVDGNANTKVDISMFDKIMGTLNTGEASVSYGSMSDILTREEVASYLVHLYDACGGEISFR